MKITKKNYDLIYIARLTSLTLFSSQLPYLNELGWSPVNLTRLLLMKFKLKTKTTKMFRYETSVEKGKNKNRQLKCNKKIVGNILCTSKLLLKNKE